MTETIEKVLKYSPMYFNPAEGEVIFLNLNVSDTCNYRCLKCFQGKMQSGEDSLGLEGLIEIVDQAKDELGIKAMYVSGRGETFFVGGGNIGKKLRNYQELIKHANDKGVAVCQFTNGYYLDPEMVDFLAVQDVSIVVSLDTLDEERYSEIFVPPKGAFQRVMNNLDYARSKFPHDDSVYRLGINTAISHVNIEEVDRIREFCGNDIIFFSNYPMIRGNFKENLERMCISEEEYGKFIQKCKETSAYHHLAGMCQNGACGFYYNGLTIDVNGDVLLSPYDISTGKLFGNISDYENMQTALTRVRGSIASFLHEFPDAKSCPLRHRKYHEFPKHVS